METNSVELCLLFVNTVSWRLRNPSEERLPTPHALVQWLADNGLAKPRYVHRLSERWTAEDRSARQFHEAAVRLREAIYDLLLARIEKRPPRTDSIDVLSGWISRPAPGVELARDGIALSWRPSSLDADPHDLLQPIAQSAANLMTGARAGKVRQCSDDRGCGWLFVDESRAQNRRWCAMGDCGNRAKAARHRARRRTTSGSA